MTAAADGPIRRAADARSRCRPGVALLFCLTAAPMASANPVTCEYDGLARKVEVVYVEPGQAVPCEVIYDKSAEGSIESLWQANHEALYCEAQAAGLVDKLRRMGWRCDVDAAPAAET